MWVTKDVKQAQDRKIFYILMEMNVIMAINCKLQFSPTIYANLQSYVDFKANFHQISISERKDPAQKWHDFPYLATDDAIDVVLDKWSAEWHTTMELAVGGRNSTT